MGLLGIIEPAMRRLAGQYPWRVRAAILYLGLMASSSATSNVTVIMRTGDLLPDGDGTISKFVDPPDINDLGELLVHVEVAGSTSDGAILKYTLGGGTTILERVGNPYPLGGTSSAVQSPVNNNAGHSAYGVRVSPTQGAVIREIGGAKMTMVASTQSAPGGGNFSGLVAGEMNEAGHIVFRATLTGTPLGADDDSGIYVAKGMAITEIVRELIGTPWTSIASKSGSGAWVGSADITTGTPSNGFVEVTVDNDEHADQLLFRMAGSVQ